MSRESKKYSIKFIDESLNYNLKNIKQNDKELYTIISNGLIKVSKNPTNSILVKKKNIPKYYIKKFNVSNLRIFKLNRNWRLIYTIASDEIQILAIVLEWLNHKDYEKRFSYSVK